MKRVRLVLLFISFAFFGLSFSLSSYAQTETLEIVTYYPAPYGVYQHIRTTQDTWLATDSGNVGIGTINPAAKLDTTGTIRTTGFTEIGTGEGLELLYNGTQGEIVPYDRTNSAYKPLGIYGDPVLINPQQTFNVGIGTTSPAQPLHVQREGSTGYTPLNYGIATFEKGSGSGFIQIMTGNATTGGILFSDDDSNPGGIYYRHNTNVMDFRTNDTYQVSINSDGSVTVQGCISDGTCEIFAQEDALSIIKSIMRKGDGTFNEYGHEHLNMEKIYLKYPYLINKQEVTNSKGEKEIKYFDKLGAKSDLLYRATMQLVERIEALQKENEMLKQRVGILEKGN